MTEAMEQASSGTEPAYAADRLPEVSRLAVLLVRDVLDAQSDGRPVSDASIRSLLNAGLLLKQYDIELPPLLGQIMLAAEVPEVATGIGDRN